MNIEQAGAQVLHLRRAGGFACPVAYGLIAVSGPDTVTFLQSRTTNDVAALASGTGQYSCLLDRKAHIQAYFSLHKLDDSYYLIAQQDQISKMVDELSKYLFNEKVEIVDCSLNGLFAAVQGTAGRRLLAQALTSSNLPGMAELDIASGQLWGCSVILIKKSITGEDGFFIWIDKAHRNLLEARLHLEADGLELTPLSEAALDISRIEAGMPRCGIDISEEYLLPETGLQEKTVSYTKGCYLGQEVIARIKAFGAPRRSLTGLVFPPGKQLTFAPGTEINAGGQKIGIMKSNVYSPALERTIALCYLNKEHLMPDTELHCRIAGLNCQATIKELPFYPVHH